MKANLVGTVQSICRRFSGMLKALVVGAAITLAGTSAQAVSSTTVGGVTWYWDFIPDSTTEIYIGRGANQAAVVGASGTVTVPSTLAGYTVKKLGQYAFYNCTGVTSVTIPSSITTINEYVFKGCTGLTSVSIPSSVTFVGTSAFEGCSSLASVTLPSGVTSLGNYAFKGCTSLLEANIPVYFWSRNVSTAFSGASSSLKIWFYGTKVVDTRTWHYRAVKVGSTPYVELRNMAASATAAVSPSPTSGTLKVPATIAIESTSYAVRGFGSNAFRACKMETIAYPNTVTNIASTSMRSAYGLKYFTISNTVLNVGTYAFYNCTNLESVVYASTSKVPKIQEYTFGDCSKLAKISIPDSVTTLAATAFKNCTGLEKVDMPGRFDGTITISSVFSGANPLATYVYRQKVGNIVWYYTVDASGNAWVHNGDDAAVDLTTVTSLTVPTTLGGHTVTTIGPNAFRNFHNLTTVTIPEGVTMINNYAFDGCGKLTTVNMPSTLQTIGWYAFRNCTSLTKVTIPDAVSSVGQYAFSGCTKLSKVIMPVSLRGANYMNTSNVFKDCSSSLAFSYTATATYNSRTFRVLLSGSTASIGDGVNPSIVSGSTTGALTIPSSITVNSTSYTVTEISDGAFKNYTGITSVTIPSSITRIGGTAFYMCSGLTSAPLLDCTNLETIDWQAFAYCSKLSTLSLPRKLKTLGQYAFDGCSKLSTVTFNSPDSGTGLTAIKDYTFRDCTNLTTVTLPYEVATISANAFEACTKLKEIYLPISFIGSFSTLKSSTFPDCPSALTFGFCGKQDYNSKTWYYVVTKVKSGSAYNTYTELRRLGSYIYPAVSPKPTGSISTPYQLNTSYGTFDIHGIGKYGFYNCADMTAVGFGSPVTNIGYAAFQKCYKLTGITIPNSVEGIGTYAFSDCTNATSISISTKLKKIPGYAFQNCSKLTSVTVPDSVTEIAANAFKGCTKLSKAYLPRAMLDTIRDGSVKEVDIFPNCPENMYIYYGYNTSSEVCAQIIALLNGAKYVWYGELNPDGWVSLLKSGWPVSPEPEYDVEVPPTICGYSVKELGYGFRNMKRVTEVWLPNSVKSIGEDAFNGCTELTKITYNSGFCPTNIMKRAFEGCTSLTVAPLLNGLETIGLDAFNGCTGLTSLTIPASVTLIDDRAFQDCSNIGTLTFASGSALRSIGQHAFHQCTKLTTITIPESVTTLWNWAFFGCTSLATAYLPPDLYGHVSENTVFKNCSPSLKIYYQGKTTDGWFFRVVGTFQHPIGYQARGVEVTGKVNAATDNTIAIPTYLNNNTDKTVVSISANAFSGHGMTTVSFPSDNFMTNIGAHAFESCTHLTSVTIPDGVLKLGTEAFRNCSALASASLPGELFGKVNESDVFKSTPALSNRKITYRMGTKDGVEYFGETVNGIGILYKVVGGKAIIESGANNVCAFLTKPTGSYTIPSTLGGYPVGGLGTNAFIGCSGLTSVSFPNSLTEIGYGAFQNCTGLTSMTVPDTVTSLGEYAFAQCTNLRLVSLPDALRSSFNANVFTNCPDDLRVTFRMSGGISCDYVDGAYWFYKIVGEGAQLFRAYTTPCVDPAPTGAVTIPDMLGGKSVTSIGGDAFYNCTGMTGVEIPNTVTAIASSAFYRCLALESVEIPDSVTTIAASAFQECSALESVTIPSSVTTLGNYAFYNCDSLTEVTIPGSITVIGDYAFKDCDGLDTVVMGEGVQTIGAHSFEHCDVLREVTIPSTVTFIGVDAFKDCPLLAKINVPTGKKDDITDLLEASGLTVPDGLVQKPDPGKWQITFNPNGGTCATTSMQVTKGQAIGELPSATKSGFSLVGWFTAAEGGSQVTTATVPDGDKTYYARWSQNTYKVTFNANGGTPATTEKTYAENATLGSLGLPEVTWTDHNFMGWFTASSGGTQVYATTPVTKVATYYAHWQDVEKYTVTFNADGGSVVGDASIQVAHGATIGSALPSATRTGYDFKGWKDGSGNTVTASTAVNGNLSCTAQWQAKSFTVTFNAQGGTVSPTSQPATYDSAYGTLPTPFLAGSNFQGWFTEASGGTQVTAASIYKQDGNQTLYAHWEAIVVVVKHTVTFDPAAADATVSPATIQVEHGVTIGTLPEPERAGYTFLRWTMLGNVEVTPTVAVMDDIVCTAQWQANTYTVEFDPGAGEVLTADMEVTYDSAYGTLPVPTLAGSSFKGWFTEPSGAGTQVTAATIVKIASDHVLYANWEETPEGSFTVTFDANGGTCAETSRTVVEGQKIGAFPAVARDGYDFHGWIGSFGETVNADTVVTENITCVAQWQAKTFTVTFNAQGGTVTPTSTTVTYDSAYGELPTPVKADNTFVGWFTAIDGGEKVAAETIVKITATQTLYAHWVSSKVTSWTDTSTTPPLTWYYRMMPDGSNGVELYNDGACAVSPAPNGYLDIPKTINGYPVMKIGDHAFDGCVAMTGVSIPFTVTAIGDFAFATSGLSDEVIIPSLTKTLGMGAFSGCQSLKYVTIGSGVEEMGDLVFHDCTALAAVLYPTESPLKVLPAGAFNGCTSLTASVNPPAVEVIGAEAYKGCTFVSAYIFKNVKEIKQGAFEGVPLLVVNVSPMDKDRVKQMLEDSGFDTSGITFDVLPEPFEISAGEFFKATLEDLGFDYCTPGDHVTPYTVTALGLPSGLKLKSNAAVKDKKGKVTKKAKVDWWIEGVPTAALDSTTQPTYLTFAVPGEDKRTEQISISVTSQQPTDLNDPSLWGDVAIGQTFGADDLYTLPGVGKSWTVTGLPTGLKFATKKVTKKSGKKTVTVAEAYTVYGKTTKAGLFTVTAKKKNGAYYETLKFKVLVTPKDVDTANFKFLSDKTSTAYEDYIDWYVPDDVGGDVAKVTGLPTGLKFAAKDTYGYTNAKKKTGKYLIQEGQTIVGTPTKVGTFVVTFTRNVKSGKKTVAKTAQILWTVNANPNKPEFNFNPGDADIEEVSLGVKSTNLLAFAATKGATVTASGLPSGMSLKKLDDDSWGITGYTTKAGLYLVTVKAVVNGNTVTQRRAIQVNAIPKWARGTFNGFVTGDGGIAQGLATITVSSVGKISGKFTQLGTNWTFSAASFTDYDGAYKVPVTATYSYKVKSGKKTVTKKVTRSFTLEVGEGADNGVDLTGIALLESEDGTTVQAWQNLWGSTYKKAGTTHFYTSKKKPYKEFKQTIDVDGQSCALALKVTSAGVLTATLTYDTGKKSKGKPVYYKPTCSTVLVPTTLATDVSFSGEAMLYFAPSAGNNFPGWADAVIIAP